MKPCMKFAKPPRHLRDPFPHCSEKAFTKQVLDLARLNGWRSAHFRPAKTAKGRWLTPVAGDAKGFPDLVLVRGHRFLVAELKVGKNTLKPEQDAWLSALALAGVECHVWRPECWPAVERTLSGRGGQ